MSKKLRLREPFDKQHGTRAKALLKSASMHIFHIYWIVPIQLSYKTSLLLTCQILGLLVKTSVADEKYPVLTRDNLTIPIQVQWSPKQKTFSEFFAAFLKFQLNFEYFEVKYNPHRFCILEITDCENMVREMSKTSRFRGPFNKQHCNPSEAPLNSASQHLYPIHWSLPSQLNWKKSLLLKWQMLGLFLNTLATDEKYPLLKRNNLTVPIQRQLSQKHKTFSQFFTVFSKSRWKFEHFETEDDLQRVCIFEIADS